MEKPIKATETQALLAMSFDLWANVLLTQVLKADFIHSLLGKSSEHNLVQKPYFRNMMMIFVLGIFYVSK